MARPSKSKQAGPKQTRPKQARPKQAQPAQSRPRRARSRKAASVPASSAKPPELRDFCERLLNGAATPAGTKKKSRGGATQRDGDGYREIDIGSRWAPEKWKLPGNWSNEENQYRQISDGEVEPTGYSFEVMVFDQFLLRSNKHGGFIFERRRRGVLSPKVIGEKTG